MSLLDWFKKGSYDKKKSRKQGRSSGKGEEKNSAISISERNTLRDLEIERIKNQAQESRIKNIEQKFQQMQEKWVSLLEKQQKTMEGVMGRRQVDDPSHPSKDMEDRLPVRERNDDLSSPVIQEKSFNNFVVDDSNRFPYLAAEAVATGVGRKYNPLFVFGPVGVGKTHLLHAIANKMLDIRSDTVLMYSSTERFTDELLKALEKDDLEGFRSRYRELDVLLIDDIQMLSGREATQHEFFHMFNHLYNSGKQIVLCSDRPPSEIRELETRLKSRFEGGLTIDIKVPTFEGRRQILVNLSQRDGFSLSTEVLDYMAFYLDSSVRELEGGFNRVTAYASLMKEPITVSLIRKVLEGFVNRKNESGSELVPKNKKAEIQEIELDLSDPYGELDLEEETDQVERDLLLELKKNYQDQ